MKKVLIGCGIVTLVSLILFVGCTIFLTMKVKGWGEEVGKSFEALQTLDQDFSFTAPEGNVLEEERLDTFMEMRGGIVDQFLSDPLVKEIMTAKSANTQPDLSMGDFIGFAGRLPKMIDSVGEILRQHEMSPEEYAYYAHALAHSVAVAAETDAELGKVMDIVKEMVNQSQAQLKANQSGQNLQLDLRDEFEKLYDLPVPAQNLALMEKHREEIIKAPFMLGIELIMADFYEAARAAGPRSNVVDYAEEVEKAEADAEAVPATP